MRPPPPPPYTPSVLVAPLTPPAAAAAAAAAARPSHHPPPAIPIGPPRRCARAVGPVAITQDHRRPSPPPPVAKDTTCPSSTPPPPHLTSVCLLPLPQSHQRRPIRPPRASPVALLPFPRMGDWVVGALAAPAAPTFFSPSSAPPPSPMSAVGRDPATTAPITPRHTTHAGRLVAAGWRRGDEGGGAKGRAS
ncbi:hypothetical protein I4F81_011206 [Pyropia yezoensis]|uniref:Uncharacterized protein n=1 Tax=Pyropia yezoensis TaxID=2788 RepID=A0ACC3CFT7_PYRYE|nr:hypothetical protein I4F81_011206 [Neopyropia yezoensis]